MVSSLILRLVDPFYPLVKRFLTLQTYRYGMCGAANTAFDIVLYFLFYNFILEKKSVDLGLLSVSPHIAAFFLAFMISFPTGFFLMRLVVFPESTIRGRVQLIRYFSVVMLNVFLNYVLLKLFVDFFRFYPTPSKFAITVIIVGITYLLQKHFTFKEKIVAEPVFVSEEQTPAKAVAVSSEGQEVLSWYVLSLIAFYSFLLNTINLVFWEYLR